MKATTLKQILEDVIKKYGDVDVAVIDIEGEMIPLEPQVVIDEDTHSVGIDSNIDSPANEWAGNEGEWTDESWANFKWMHSFKDC